jgi:hypothetical protein
MKKFKGTKGQWYVNGDKYATIESRNTDEKIVVIYPTIATVNSTFIDIEEFRANALLIAEAGNIRQQIPFSLTELKRQRDEMLEMLNSIVENYKSGNEDNFIMSNLIDKSENLIKEATEI